MSPQLRPYQQQLISDARDAMRHHRRICIVLPTGGGKSAIAGFIAATALQRARSVYVVAQRRRLIQQLSDTMHRWGASGALVQSVQSIRPHAMPAPDLLLVDECFPAGTLVDGRPIESWRPGELVDCYDHATDQIVQRPVVRLFKRKAPATMVTVCFSNGSEFTCTAEHPVYADGEYVPAAQLKPGANVVTSTTLLPSRVPVSLRHVWQCRWPAHQTATGSSAKARRVGLLLQRVLQSLSVLGFLDHCREHQPQIRIRKDAEEQSHASRGSAGQGFNISPRNGMEAASPRGEWQRTDGASDVACFNAWVGNGVGRQNRTLHKQQNRLSKLLQAGHWMFNAAGWYRGGWSKPSLARTDATRPKERRNAEVARVDSVEVFQRRSDGRSGEGCSDRFVYNLEVAEHHNYFAEGVLVHNCHHLVAGNQWGRLIDAWPDARLVGLTATPARLDGVGLGVGHGGYFEHLVLGPDAAWLTAQGFLAPARVYSWPLSMAGVRTRCGDYDQQQATQRMVAVMGDAVTEYQRLLSGQTAIANCCSVAHAEAVAEAFRAAGIPAAALTGHTSRQQQDQLFADLTRGTLKVLAQCEMVSEGVDIPAVAGALMLRPTQSLVVWLQQLGRALRPAPGKAQAIILDHAGNAHRPGLGLPTDPREWTLEGRKRRKADPAAAVRSCPVCFCCVPAEVPECPECGHVWQTVTRKVEIITGELQELQRIERRRSVGRARSREELEAIRLERGYQRGWTDRILAARGGRR